MVKQKTIILSLGGSLIVPGGVVAIDFLKKFRALILKFLKQNYRFVIIAGGGGTNRLYNQGARAITKIKNIDLDWLGIAVTKVNAELLRVIFSSQSYSQVIFDPRTKIRTRKKIIIASGWVPGFSSDKDAVLWAKNLKVKKVINLSDIDYVYNKDPKKNQDAKPIKKITWSEFQKIVGTKWSPRKSLPFDPIASQLARNLKLEVIVLNGKNIKNFENCLKEKNFKGTLIN
ncbi:MAG: UMP kinase [Patescibacteria group bacterium]|jgi:uridylate kinase|nr:UMP kinase [Patescibacteria group bacterium]MDD5172862.1 UMP kinase [Patescibacteria group bacterium]